MSTQKKYRGRFAPSPTGPLHFGSLVAAMASYLDAKANQGEWLVRIEDVDEQRNVSGAAESILHTLETFQFEWDGEIVYQTQRKQRYAEIIRLLQDREKAYPCGCTRADIEKIAVKGAEGFIYPGTCRNGLPAGKTKRATRLRTDDYPISFTDSLAGYIEQQIESEIGDFIIHRADGFTAYQLAVVVDDADQGITDIVRGSDLLNSTARQIYLQKLLGFATPRYAHLPLVLDNQGRKLCKQTGAAAVDEKSPLSSLLAAWAFLFGPVDSEAPETIEDFWYWATSNWQLEKIGGHS